MLLNIIPDFLGYADIKTREIYSKINLERKEPATIKKVSTASTPKLPSRKEIGH